MSLGCQCETVKCKSETRPESVSAGKSGGLDMNHPLPLRTLVVQPDDGVEPVLELLATARQSLRVKQFTLSEPRLVQGLIDAHGRGVAVRVMLNPHRSSGDRPNDPVFGQLQQTGIAVQWTNTDYVITHEKS